MKKIQELLTKLRSDEKGATVIEYALIAALVAVVAIVAIGAIGQNVNKTFSNVASAINAT